MKTLHKHLSFLIHFIESSPTSFSFWCATFFAIIFSRILVESWISGFSNHSVDFLFAEFSHTFLFFLLSYIAFLWLLSFATKTPLKQSSTLLLWGFLIILTPPIFDFIISHGAGFWSFYKFDGLSGLWIRFLTFFGDAPTIGITYGVRIEVALSLLFFFLYILVKTKKLLSSFVWTGVAYIFFFILGTLPSWITIAITGFSKGFFSVSATDIAQMFLTPQTILSQPAGAMISVLNVKMSIVYALVLSGLFPLLGVYYFKKQTISLIKNSRLPQSLYHCGLLSVGAGLGILFSGKSFSLSFFDFLSFVLLLIAVEFAWLTSVIVNDLFDTKIDTVTNTKRPLIQNIFSREQYALIAWIFFFASLFFSAIAFPPAIGFLFLYQSLAWLYSAWPLRLKRFPVVATFVSAVASILLLFLGYIALSPTRSLENLPASIVILLLFAYTVSLPIKDFKDIAGDKKDGVHTIPVLFGETKGRLIVATGIFFSFVLSIWALNDPTLTLWSIFFGALAFWTVATSHRWKHLKITPRNLPLTLLFFVTLYGIVIVSKMM